MDFVEQIRRQRMIILVELSETKRNSGSLPAFAAMKGSNFDSARHSLCQT
jgi:hypothetical protein